ncbi:MAG: cytochrome c biogenesis protein CcdA [Chloroflexota bacterium]|nr:cytochrome c biogenesis protein CcdA [Chloroflexota bacterium]MDE2683800.1 cytochrome c biogenesis protein CcdA [Chloroflexota bacterium]
MAIPANTAETAPSFMDRIQARRGILIAVGIAAVAYAIAVLGALWLRNAEGIDGVNRFVELLSGSSGSSISNVGIKLGFAYAVGAASAVNPCGFAMLPAYLGLYVGGGNQDDDRRNPVRLVSRAVMVGLSVSLGFVVLFGAVGLILGLGSQAVVVAALPYVGLAIGVLLIGAGAYMASGGKIYTSLAQRAASRVGDPNQLNIPGYVLFGVSYGLASLSCTLPLFLAVLGVGAGLSSGFLDTVGQFVLYAAGMGSVIMALTLGMAVARSVLIRWMRAALPYVGVVGAWLMVVAGTYIVFYWLTLGDLL